MKFRKFITCVIVAGLAALFSTTQAQEMIYSGFMTDYTQLEKITDGSMDYRYVAPGAMDKLAQYNAVMIDQPEIFIANDSPYRGVKPKQLNALADGLRAAIAGALSEDFYVVDTPGKKVLYLSVALTNLKLTKKKKSILGYTPAGLVTGAVRGAATSNIAKKANLQGVVLELEAFDSITNERLVAIIDSRGSDAKNTSSWEELEELMAIYGSRLQCRFNNSRLPAEQRVNCLARD
ncbi:MAG: DUF3313 domain-containing protein [Proteobacteria bacterium]|nr:DUF3313 domain-containing protein [Pseudomonadota bacterium]